jgi:hypothetical protein
MCVMCMYFIPLFVIIGAYTAIMCEISKNSKETKGEWLKASNKFGIVVVVVCDFIVKLVTCTVHVFILLTTVGARKSTND